MERSSYSASQLDIISFCDAIDESRAVMTDRDKNIYNLLGRATNTKVSKLSYTHSQGYQERGSRMGTCPGLLARNKRPQ